MFAAFQALLILSARQSLESRLIVMWHPAPRCEGRRKTRIFHIRRELRSHLLEI
jgi:hypothetical protein